MPDEGDPAVVDAMAAEAEAIAAEAEGIVGSRPTAVEPLLHSQHGVTVGVWRVRTGATRAIRKVVAPRPEAGLRVADPTSFRYWLREPLILDGGLPAAYRDAGLWPPRLLAHLATAPDRRVLWLEDVEPDQPTRWGPADIERVGRRLGVAQGRLAVQNDWQQPWLSTTFLREYLADAEAHTPMELLDDDAAWATPLVARTIPSSLRPGLMHLFASRDRLLHLLETCPRTLSHLDVWPANLFPRRDGTVLIDWAFAGGGALGEDIGNLVPDAVNDLHVPGALLPELDRAAFHGYVVGLRDAGWEGDEREVRLGMCASAVKYVWLAAAMLERARRASPDASVPGYGGADVDVERLFSERASVLGWLVDRAAEAERIAAVLGRPRGR
jgi:hypothetical protein